MMTSLKLKNFLTNQATRFVAICVYFSPSIRVKKFLFSKVYSPYFGWRKLEIEWRTFFRAKMLLSLPDSIQTNIFLTGRWEPSISHLISNSLSLGDIFIDIGANIGYHTLLASHTVGRPGKVYAIEASPQIFDRLRYNVSLNQMSNVQLLNVAVSNQRGTIWLWKAPSGNIGHSTIMDEIALADGHEHEAEVPSDILSELIDLEDLLTARMIKLDIEGAERLAIEGILSLLERFSSKTEWIIELSPEFSESGRADSEWIFGVFTAAGYDAYKIHNSYKTMLDDSWNPTMRQMECLLDPPNSGLHDILFSKTREASHSS